MVESANELEDIADDEEEARDEDEELGRLGEDGDEILEDDEELDCSTLMLELEEDSPKVLLLD